MLPSSGNSSPAMQRSSVLFPLPIEPMMYDEAIDWNDPIIIYDENGEVIYDPSQPDYYKDKYSESDPGISDEELGLEPEPTIEEVD